METTLHQILHTLHLKVSRNSRRSLLFKEAGLRSYADRHVAARVQVAPLDGDPGSARDGPLRRLDASEVRSLDKRWGGDKDTFYFENHY